MSARIVWKFIYLAVPKDDSLGVSSKCSKNRAKLGVIKKYYGLLLETSLWKKIEHRGICFLNDFPEILKGTPKEISKGTSREISKETSKDIPDKMQQFLWNSYKNCSTAYPHDQWPQYCT